MAASKEDSKTMKSPNILITGASGFIGGFLVKEALDRGYVVWAGVRKNSDRSNLSDPRIHCIELKYDHPAELTSQLKQLAATHGPFTYVIHNAGLTKTLDKRNFFRVNATYTQHFIDALAHSGIAPEKFLLMSSLSSFGKGDETTFRPIALKDKQEPDTVYGQSKLLAENYLREQTYFPYVILRPTGVYGPGEKDYFMEIKSIQSGFDFAVGTTPQRITFIYVKDLARVAFLALENRDVVNKEYFVADGDVHTDESFARMIQDILGKKHVFRARVPLGLVRIACVCSEWMGKIIGKSMTLNTDKYIILKQRNWICETKPLQEELSFTPSYDLKKGLEECITWYQANGWL